MSYTAVKWAFKQEGLTPVEKLVLIRIAESERDGSCFPARETIAHECGVSEKSVSRAIKKFVELGLLTVEKQWKRNRYVPNLEALSGDTMSHDNGSQGTSGHVTACQVTSCPVTEDTMSPDQGTPCPSTIENHKLNHNSNHKGSEDGENDRGELKRAVEAWNEFAEDVGLPTVRKLTSQRKAALRARLKECGGLPGWRDVLARIRGSPFLLGEGPRGWKADIDFVLSETKFNRILEGKYDGGNSPVSKQSELPPSIAALAGGFHR